MAVGSAANPVPGVQNALRLDVPLASPRISTTMLARTHHWMPLTLAALVAGCATADHATNAPSTAAVEINLRMRLSNVGPGGEMEGNRTMRELAAQTPLGYDKPIRLLSGPLPPHPPFGGEVTVRFAVDAQGNVVRPQLLRATAASTLDVSPALLGNATVRALAQWRFTPPVRGGEPTELCCIRLTID